MTHAFRRALALVAVCSVCACTSENATKDGIVGFNQVFSQARDEILLLNILRARDDDSQQFSTVSGVTGSMRPQISVSGELDNLILGASKIFKPSGSFGLRNPQVTIAPLETKEFRTGMMKPLTAESVDQLLAAGWPGNVVLNLVVGGVTCGSRSYFNSGLDDDAVRAFEQFAYDSRWDIRDANVSPIANIEVSTADADRVSQLQDAEHLNFQLLSPGRRGQQMRLAVSKESLRTVVVPAQEGMKILRSGAGAGLKVRLIASDESDAAGTVRLVISEASPERIVVPVSSEVAKKIVQQGTAGLSLERADQQPVSGIVRFNIINKGKKKIVGLGALYDCPAELPPEKLIFRSPEAMIQYLGALARQPNPSSYFSVEAVRLPRSQRDAVRTRYHGIMYAVPRSGYAPETLALLADIIGFQTTDATLNASKPTVTVPTE